LTNPNPNANQFSKKASAPLVPHRHPQLLYGLNLFVDLIESQLRFTPFVCGALALAYFCSVVIVASGIDRGLHSPLRMRNR
ncbi:hypothetical protein U1Q18_024678, partial [Sarracenia purpurea var. burkii]